jgi:hypothetical protein
MLSAAYYALRSIKPYIFQEVMKMVYYIYFHSTMSYGIISSENSIDSTKTFKMQKKEIRIIIGSKNRDSCRDLFKNLKILPFHSQYILSLLLFVVDNKSMYNLNSDTRNIKMRQKLNFHQHSANLSLYQKGIHFFSIKVFNSLPQSLKKPNTNIK